MTPLARGVLIAGGLMVVIFAAGIAAVMWWVSEHGDEFTQQTKSAMREGMEAGVGKTGKQCIDAAVERARAGDDRTAGLKMNLWMQGCLAGSTTDPAFCKDVPSPLAFIDSVQWRKTQCQARGLGKQPACQHIFTAVQAYCDANKQAPAAER